MNIEQVVTDVFGFQVGPSSTDGASFRQFTDANIGVDSLPARGAIFHASHAFDPLHCVFIMSRMFRITECDNFQPVQVPGTIEKFKKAYASVDSQHLLQILPKAFKDNDSYSYTKKWTNRRAFNVDISVTTDERGIRHITTLVGVTRYQTRVGLHYRTTGPIPIASYLSTVQAMLRRTEVIQDLEYSIEKYYNQIKPKETSL